MGSVAKTGKLESTNLSDLTELMNSLTTNKNTVSNLLPFNRGYASSSNQGQSNTAKLDQ